MPRAWMLSESVDPPWTHGSKNLAKTLSEGMSRWTLAVPQTGIPTLPNAYTVAHASPKTDMFRRALAAKDISLLHFLFTANPRTAFAARALVRARRCPSVHTHASIAARLRRASLFADVNVVQSSFAQRKLEALGLPERKICKIAPCIPQLVPPSQAERRRARQALGIDPSATLLLYAGDLEFGGAADLALEVMRRFSHQGCESVVASRAKTPTSRVMTGLLNTAYPGVGRWLGTVPNMHELLGCADVLIFAARSTEAKVDYPLVVLEALGLGARVVATGGTPLDELAPYGVRISAFDADDLEKKVSESIAPRTQQSFAALHRALYADFSSATICQAYQTLYDSLLAMV